MQLTQPELWRISKRMVLAILVVAAGGCKGSIKGTVMGTNGEPGVPVTGHPVYLVPATPETAAALRAVCPPIDPAAVPAQRPAVPVTLIETLAMQQAPSGEDGSYAFTNVPPGRYLVAVELADGYRWLPVQVDRRTAVANVRPLGSKDGCEIAQLL